MNLWLLDTDIVSFCLADQPLVNQRLAIAGNDAVISIVTVHEVFNGWVARINSAKTIEETVFLYGKLSKALALFRKVRVLDFDDKASVQLKKLLTQYPNLDKSSLRKDMRIAAIALANNANIITRNYRDFSLVPGLVILDWSQP
ncbi:MAG: type II toxin-antitoxin system VapC family toxin [Alkalinema sp. RU_4_3]|nr:type II toxin-antitoxin system VapC family toxin [Alkalinema sp. RU_4_3]